MHSWEQQVKDKKIFVGLSGGVDSAVSAALLKRAGAQVVGVFIKGWYPPDMPCTWADDRRDAMRVAAHLGISFHTLDARTEYKRGVIDYLLSEYARGHTPNPDIMCNREVKFGAFYSFAKEHGADFIATGHYARAQALYTANGRGERKVPTHMLRGVDATKDQSYFLWAIPQEVLNHTIFPIGHLEKSAVRQLAEKFAVPVAKKKDSQGICFLGSISVDDFLRSELHPEAGNAIDETGVIVGAHEGAVLYTLGQRIALSHASTGPWYVSKKDIRGNTLTVSYHTQKSNNKENVRLTETNWFDVPDDLSPSEILSAQYRYHGLLVEGKLNIERNSFAPNELLCEPIAVGQSLVLYRGEECIGGGIIS